MSKKIYSFLATLLVVALLIPLNVFASTNQNIQKNIHNKHTKIKLNRSAELVLKEKSSQALISKQLKKRNASKSKSSAISKAKSLVTANPTYTGSIDAYTIDVYHFSTNGGTVQVNDLDQSDFDDYYIAQDTGEDITEDYKSGDTLPAGNYVFVVYSVNDTPESYSFEVSNITLTSGDTNIPTISLTKPSKRVDILSRTATSTTVTGTSSANVLEYLSTTSGDFVNITPTSSFNFNLSLSDGYNNLMFHAVSVSGNEKYSTYTQVVPSIQRIGGADRYEVSANVYSEISKYFDLGTVVIASGDVYTDALSGGPLAYQYGGPVLLTTKDSLPTATKNIINSVKPTHAIILGGTGSVSTSIETELSSLGLTNIERVSGADRYEVSANVAQRLGTISSETAVIVSGLVYSDALTSSSVALNNGMPILQVLTDSIPTSIQTYITNHPEIKNFIVVGGPGTVSDSVLTQLSQIRPTATVDRIGGADRFEVGINLINYFGLNVDSLTFNNGLDFPDAMSSAPLAAYLGSPVLLVQPTLIPTSINNFLDANNGKTYFIYIVGGPASISTTVENQLSTRIPN